jgi:hypothetical protein
MTHLGCPSCRLRFTAASVVACPECGQPPQPIGSAEDLVGFRLFLPTDSPQKMPEAVAVSLPSHGIDVGRS